MPCAEHAASRACIAHWSLACVREHAGTHTLDCALPLTLRHSRITVVGGKPPWPLGAESGSPQGYATTTPVATPQNQPNSAPRALLSTDPNPRTPQPTPNQLSSPFPKLLIRSVDVNTARGIRPWPILAPKPTPPPPTPPFAGFLRVNTKPRDTRTDQYGSSDLSAAGFSREMRSALR